MDSCTSHILGLWRIYRGERPASTCRKVRCRICWSRRAWTIFVAFGLKPFYRTMVWWTWINSIRWPRKTPNFELIDISIDLCNGSSIWKRVSTFDAMRSTTTVAATTSDKPSALYMGRLWRMAILASRQFRRCRQLTACTISIHTVTMALESHPACTSTWPHQ